MNISKRMLLPAQVLISWLALSGPAPAIEPAPAGNVASNSKATQRHARIDRSGKARKGTASYYGHEFYRKKMANGKRMNPNSNVAASKTLPLGTKAKVTNLDTGKSEIVNIEDRGPYIQGRIIDVSPATAEKLDMKKDGTAPVQVKPLELPPKEASETQDATVSPK